MCFRGVCCPQCERQLSGPGPQVGPGDGDRRRRQEGELVGRRQAKLLHEPERPHDAHRMCTVQLLRGAGVRRLTRWSPQGKSFSFHLKTLLLFYLNAFMITTEIVTQHYIRY